MTELQEPRAPRRQISISPRKLKNALDPQGVLGIDIPPLLGQKYNLLVRWFGLTKFSRNFTVNYVDNGTSKSLGKTQIKTRQQFYHELRESGIISSFSQLDDGQTWRLVVVGGPYQFSGNAFSYYGMPSNLVAGTLDLEEGVDFNPDVGLLFFRGLDTVSLNQERVCFFTSVTSPFDTVIYSKEEGNFSSVVAETDKVTGISNYQLRFEFYDQNLGRPLLPSDLGENCEFCLVMDLELIS